MMAQRFKHPHGAPKGFAYCVTIKDISFKEAIIIITFWFTPHKSNQGLKTKVTFCKITIKLLVMKDHTAPMSPLISSMLDSSVACGSDDGDAERMEDGPPDSRTTDDEEEEEDPPVVRGRSWSTIRSLSPNRVK